MPQIATMRKTAILSLVIVLITLASCHKGSQASLRLAFNPMFGSSNLSLNKTYQSPDGKYYNFSTFMLYISHIKLIHTDGSMVEVKSIAYLSPNNSNDMSIPLSEVEGTYKGIQFSIGLDSVQDNTPPGSISDTTNPLSVNNGMYWPGSGMNYVFVILQGYADSNANPSTPIDYLVGSAPYYTTVQVNKSFTITSGSHTTLTLNSDLQKIFFGGTNPINVIADPYTETQPTGVDQSNVPYTTLAHTFMTDFSQSFSLQ
jgi:hypothetical protein